MNTHSTSLRLPADAKAFIEAEAKENASSQNSEIVRAIRERMKAKPAAGSDQNRTRTNFACERWV